MKTNYKSICILILVLFIALLQFSCTITFPEIEEGSKLLEDGLWRLRANVSGFGRNVDIYNNTAIVSAKSDSTASVHVFEYTDYSSLSLINKWNLTASLREENATLDYGNELVIGNNIIAVSDCNDNKVYTYVKTDSSWEELCIITPSNESNYSNFGKSLDISQNYLIVGSGTGPAVLYELIGNNWIEVTSLDVGDQQENSYEIQVRLSENFLATCKGRDIYMYNRSGNIISNRTLIDSTRNNSHSAYYRIDLDDSTLVVGNPTIDYNNLKIFVYSYNNGNWGNFSEIEVEIDHEELGESIVLYSDYILFRVPSQNYFTSPRYSFYFLDSSEGWGYKESLYDIRFRGNFALNQEFAIFNGLNYAYIYEYK